MNGNVMIALGYALAAVVCVLALAFVVQYWRENAPVRPAKQPWHIEITHHHTFNEDAFDQLVTIAQDLKHTSVVHEVGEQTFDDANRFLDSLLREWFEARRMERENIPAAQQFTMPPEPEERIARDLKHAKALLRGATHLMNVARERGMTLSQEAAMQQAADMLHETLDAEKGS